MSITKCNFPRSALFYSVIETPGSTKFLNMSSSFQVRPAVEHDLPKIANLNVTAFSDSPYEQALWPPHLRQRPGTEDKEDWSLRRMRNAFGSSRTHLVVAVEVTPNGEMFAGYAEWIAPERESVLHSVEGGNTKPKAAGTPPIGLDVQAMKQGNIEINKLLGGEDCTKAFQGKDQEKMWSKFASASKTSVVVVSGFFLTYIFGTRSSQANFCTSQLSIQSLWTAIIAVVVLLSSSQLGD